MKMFWYILSLVVFVGIFSCKKDKTPFPLEPPYNDLEHGWQDDFGDEDFIYPGWSFLIEDSLQFHVPQFNPSNPNEIIYYRHDYPSNSHQLVKYNLKTTEKKVLTNGIQILGEPAWSSMGQIVFSNMSHQLFLVSDNSTSTNQITNSESNLFPQWSPNGVYLYWGYAASAGQNRYFLKKDILNESIDTIFKRNFPNHPNFAHNKISRQNILFAFSLFNNSLFLTTCDLEYPVESVNHLFPLENFFPNSTSAFCWSHDSQYIYLAYHTTGKIYRVRVSDGEIELFRDQYNGNWLHSIAASPEGKYLIVERVVLSNTYTATGELDLGIRTHSQIQLIDIATKKIKILDLN